MARVFLSYAREDEAKAESLAKALEGATHEVWWDHHVYSGTEYAAAIETALEASDVVVVLWSSVSVQSGWVRDEAEEGRDRGRLIPIVLDKARPPIGFRHLQTLDLSDWNGRGSPKQFDHLLTAISQRAVEPPHVADPSGKSGRAQSLLSRRARTLLIAVMGVAAILFAGWLFSGGTLFARPSQPSIAVVPFADLSPARDKAYFAEGVAEEILSALAAEDGIKVLGRTSARHIERDASPKMLREKLGITHLLEGSARSVGDQLRVNVRLVDTSDGTRVWEEEYRGRTADVFAVQDHVAASVAQRLRRTLFEPKVRASQQTKPETYQTYLAARALARTRTDKGMKEALTLTKKVVRSDPKYAPGHALLAELYFLLSDGDGAYGQMPYDQARKLATPHAREAIRLSPNSADGYAALALIEGDSVAAIGPLFRALKLDPSRADVRVWLGLVLNFAGRHDEALHQFRAAVDIEPLWSVTVNSLIEALIAEGRYAEAKEAAVAFEAKGGDPSMLPPIDVFIAHWQGDLSSAIERAEAQRSRRTPHGHYRFMMASDLYVLGLGKEGAAALEPPFAGGFRGTFYTGDLVGLHRRIVSAGPSLWRMRETRFVLQHMARLRDWQRLAKLYDEWPFPLAEFCDRYPGSSWIFVLALRAQNRSADADRLLTCFRDLVRQEARMTARDTTWPGELEFRLATLSSLTGDKLGTLRWLDRAINRHWLGQRYSSRLSDYPQFDSIRSDSRFDGLQRTIDAKLRTERTELLSHRASRS